MAEGKGEAKVVTGVRLPRATLDTLAAVAAKQDRTVAWCIRRAVEEWLDRQAGSRRRA